MNGYSEVLFSHKDEGNDVFPGKWIELESIILIERSQTQEHKCVVQFRF